MVIGELSTPAELLVIGGGPGGYAAALRGAQLGKRVVLVERDAIGGTCLNVGCIPSKVLIHAAELAHLATSAAGTGVTLSATVNLAELKTHLRSVVTGLTDAVRRSLDRAGVEIMSGTARFSRKNRVAIVSGDDVHHVEFDDVIIATGSRPIELPGLPFDGTRILNSTDALFAFDHIPEQLVVVGGGYIGVELGTAWAKLGAGVTIIEAADGVLPEMEPRLGRVVQRRLGELGIAVRTATVALAMSDTGLIVESGGEESLVPTDQVVVCVGRRPNTDDLSLPTTGVHPDERGLLSVDAGRRAAPHVFAIGDVTSGPALAHKATAEGEVAARVASGLVATFDPAAVPAVVFSDPEIATVGLTADQATAAGADVQRLVIPLSASSRARTLSASQGHLELVADASGTVLGAHLAGPNVSELIGEMTLAIEMAATVDDVAATIHPHPTMSEGLQDAAKHWTVR